MLRCGGTGEGDMMPLPLDSHCLQKIRELTHRASCYDAMPNATSHLSSFRQNRNFSSPPCGSALSSTSPCVLPKVMKAVFLTQCFLQTILSIEILQTSLKGVHLLFSKADRLINSPLCYFVIYDLFLQCILKSQSHQLNYVLGS